MASRNPSMISVLLLAVLALSVSGCGDSELQFDPNESETSRAIREKVREEMKAERLERLAPRLSSALAAAKAAPTATGVVLPPSEEAADDVEVVVLDLSPFDLGSKVYGASCANCHGPRGAGDGPVGASLVPQPARHNDGVYMNALTNDYLFQVVKEGGAAVGKSSMMAAWGGTLSDEEIRGVVTFMRSLAEPAYDGPLPE